MRLTSSDFREWAFQAGKLAVIGAVLLAGTANAAIVTITFDSPSNQGVPASGNGLTVQGVTFNATGGANVTFGATIGTSFLNIPPLTDGVLDGEVMVNGGNTALILTFLQPTTLLSFDFVLGTVSNAEAAGVSVALSGPDFTDPSPQFGSTGAPNGFSLVVGNFSYSGSPFTQAVLTFASDAQMFAIDNLTFDPPILTPEPGSLILVVVGMVLVSGSGVARKGWGRRR